MKRALTTIVTAAVSLSLMAIMSPPAVAQPRQESGRVDAQSAAESVMRRVEQRDSKPRVATNTAVQSVKAALPSLRLSGYGHAMVDRSVGFRDGELRYISAPVAGENFVQGSNLTIILNDSGQLVDYYETLFVRMDANSGRVVIWHQGAIVFDKVATNDGIISDPDQSVQVSFSLSKFNKCLASQGIASWAIAALSAACGALCVATAGAGCALCISAAALVAGSAISLCLGKAQR